MKPICGRTQLRSHASHQHMFLTHTNTETNDTLTRQELSRLPVDRRRMFSSCPPMPQTCRKGAVGELIHEVVDLDERTVEAMRRRHHFEEIHCRTRQGKLPARHRMQAGNCKQEAAVNEAMQNFWSLGSGGVRFWLPICFVLICNGW